MITTPLLLVLAALAGVSDVSAKPVKRTGNVPGSIELSATRANRTLVDQRLKTAVKYAYFLPEDMRKRMDKWERDHEEWEIQRRAAAPCAHGPISVALKDVNNDLEYLAPVVIGTPQQEVYLQVDTGSPLLWTYSATCTGQCGDGGHLNQSQSTSFQNTPGRLFSISYQKGKVSGTVVTDVVSMGGSEAPISSAQEFGLASSAQDLGSTDSGILGMSFPFAGFNHTPIWIDQIEKGLWADKQFGVYLNRALDKNANGIGGGRLTLAGTDPTLYTGDINYVDVVYKDAAHTFGWLVSIDGLTIEDSSIDVTNQIALVDTGTTLVYGPSSKLSDMYSKINGTFPLSGNWEGFWSVPCDTDPDVSFTFGGQKYPVKREDFLIVAFSNGTCVGTFVGSGADDNEPWVLGDVFLKNVYSAYRYEPKSVGFARLAV